MPPFGYRLTASTQMSLDVYNFNATAKTVTVLPHAWGGWSVSPAIPQTVSISAKGLVSIPFTITANSNVQTKVDYPLVFDATADQQTVPSSVSQIELDGAVAGTQPSLAPSFSDVSPADGSTIAGPNVQLSAHITDTLSGVDSQRITVEVDGKRVNSHFAPSTGELSATLNMSTGKHNIWIRAYNNAHAPAAASADITIN